MLKTCPVTAVILNLQGAPFGSFPSGSAELFNELSFHLLSYLEQRLGVGEIAFENRAGAAPEDLREWERRHAPSRGGAAVSSPARVEWASCRR